MKQEIDVLKKAFCNSKTDNERNNIDLKMQLLINENPDEFAQSMADSAKDTAERATALAMRIKLESVMPAMKEDIGMIKAIKRGRTKQYTNTESFLKYLRK